MVEQWRGLQSAYYGNAMKDKVENYTVHSFLIPHTAFLFPYTHTHTHTRTYAHTHTHTHTRTHTHTHLCAVLHPCLWVHTVTAVCVYIEASCIHYTTASITTTVSQCTNITDHLSELSSPVPTAYKALHCVHVNAPINYYLNRKDIRGWLHVKNQQGLQRRHS